MKTDKEKWINDVMGSMAGHQRATPRPSLLNQIEENLDEVNPAVIRMPKWNLAAAAAVTLLIVNVFAINRYQGLSYQEADMYEESSSQSLVSNFNMYEE